MGEMADEAYANYAADTHYENEMFENMLKEENQDLRHEYYYFSGLEIITPKEMEDSHLDNAIRYFKRKGEDNLTYRVLIFEKKCRGNAMEDHKSIL